MAKHIFTYDSALFGQVISPRTFDEALTAILNPDYKSFHDVWMWRGQANIDWPIHSAAYRRLARERGSPTDPNIASYEASLLLRARHKGYNFFEGRELTDFDLLARLQHHGAATRLLDATRSALVGLYFASNQLPSKTGVLIGFSADRLGGYEGSPARGNYDEMVKHLGQHRHPVTWEPPNVTPRIASQHSQFLYSCVSGDARGSLWFEECTAMMRVIAIAPSLKVKCLKILSESFDIRDLTLFPDIYGFAHSNNAERGEYAYARW